MAELSANQIKLMVAIRDTGRPMTTEELGRVRVGRQPLGVDAVRKVMGRLEARDDDYVRGDGSGRKRLWNLTDAGVAAIADVSPPTSGRDSGDSRNRTYTVLEQVGLHELIQRAAGTSAIDVSELTKLVEDSDVYVIADVVEARNTEHAYRQVGKKVYATRGYDEDEVSIPSVAIDGKRWKPTPVKVNTETTVAVG